MALSSNRRVLVTGGAGFLGSFVVERLRKASWCSEASAPRSGQYGLREKDAVIRMYTEVQPHIGIHLAGVAGSSSSFVVAATGVNSGNSNSWER